MDEVTKDLLEALKIVTSQLERVGDTRRHKDGEFIDLGREAIARAEAALAEPHPDADGWIPWAGGKCPVPPDTLVDVKVKPRHEVMYRRFARNLEWSHDDPWCNHIDFYRIAGEEK